jgi:hypothetical protein
MPAADTVHVEVAAGISFVGDRDGVVGPGKPMDAPKGACGGAVADRGHGPVRGPRNAPLDGLVPVDQAPP